jgi:hypothetical protein
VRPATTDRRNTRASRTDAISPRGISIGAPTALRKTRRRSVSTATPMPPTLL